MSFALDAKMAADTKLLAQWKLCQVLLMNDRTYPWLILVPAIPDLRDFNDVPRAHWATLMAEIERAANALKRLHNPYKMNVAALGNVVEQLHIHVIARQKTDAAWPKPVWGVVPTQPYAPDELQRTADRLLGVL
ncbi:MAG: HIT domain-containing protein [Alphaproteobacteria bacterium]